MVIDKFLDTIQEFNLIQKGDKICVAYSGGRDSTALLSLLLEIQKDWHLVIVLGHFNHGIRPNAAEDERFVRKVASSLSIRLFVDFADVPAYAKRKKMNLEEAGRLLRYQFLERAAEQIGGAKIATGHTMSDQAETFFLRLFRGSGSRGLVGIYPIVEGRVIRPLLKIERQEIEDYIHDRGLEYRTDESNLDPMFMRNRIRKDLIPYLEKNYDPKIIPRISKLANLLLEEESFLDSLSVAKAQEVLDKREGGVVLDAEKLHNLPLALQRRVVRHFIGLIRGSVRRISFEDVEKILKLKEGRAFSLKEGLVLKRGGREIFLGEERPQLTYAYEWSGAKVLEIGELLMKFEGQKKNINGFRQARFDDTKEACLDFAKLLFPLHVRSRLAGDRYQPLGSPGRQKLKEIMRAKGIPAAQRERFPVFLSGDEIVWVLGLPVSDKYKLTSKTREVFVISLVSEKIVR